MIDRDELLRRVDLAGLLDELSSSPAFGMGRSARWRCIDPGHEDTRPSVTMYTDTRGISRWKCWSGGHGGTAIDALTTARGVTIAQALQELASRTGLEADRRHTPPPPPTTAPREPGVVDRSVVRYVEACEQILWTPAGRQVLDYLTGQRGLDPDVLRANRVGADPGPAALRRPGGLPRGGPAAVLPALGYDGEVTYAQARYLDPSPARSKYDNPANRLASNPKLGWINPAYRHLGPLLVCEGAIDALTAGTAGHRAISVLGATYINADIAAQIHRTAGPHPILLAFDTDTAGQTATRQLLQLLGDSPAWSVELPPGTDLNTHTLTAGFPDLNPCVHGRERSLPTRHP